MGRMMENNLINLGLHDNLKTACPTSASTSRPAGHEKDAGLGNGGLGRLAACFLDSMATLSLPAYGYGIRYEFGIFDQEIRNGYQWSGPRSGCATAAPGSCRAQSTWCRCSSTGAPSTSATSTASCGCAGWTAAGSWACPTTSPSPATAPPARSTPCGSGAPRPPRSSTWRLQRRDYLRAVEERDFSENISKVLYPNDVTVMGKELRLQQQYFFVACSIHDIVQRHLKAHPTSATCRTRCHPAQRHPPGHRHRRLMRVLVDLYDLEWASLGHLPRHLRLHQPHLAARALER